MSRVGQSRRLQIPGVISKQAITLIENRLIRISMSVMAILQQLSRNVNRFS
jgi:hypothetical protein